MGLGKASWPKPVPVGISERAAAVYKEKAEKAALAKRADAKAKADADAAIVGPMQKVAYEQRRGADYAYCKSRTIEEIVTLLGMSYKQYGATYAITHSGDVTRRSQYFAKQNKGHAVYWERKLLQEHGDNVQFVRFIRGGSNDEAAELILGRKVAASGVTRQWIAPPVIEPAFPVLPTATNDRSQRLSDDEGRAYLGKRGISKEIILHAEDSLALKYAPREVLFVGYDGDAAIRNVGRRSTRTGFKGDVTGTLKKFPPIFCGFLQDADQGHIHIETVEGGTSGLAVQTAALREGRPVPFVIVTGGCSPQDFMTTPIAIDLIRRATKITVNGEWESVSDDQADKKIEEWPALETDLAKKEGRAPRPTPDFADPEVKKTWVARWTDEKQTSSDAARMRQLEKIQAIRNAQALDNTGTALKVEYVMPPDRRDSDWADINLRQMRTLGLVD